MRTWPRDKCLHVSKDSPPVSRFQDVKTVQKERIFDLSQISHKGKAEPGLFDTVELLNEMVRGAVETREVAG